MYTKKDMLNSYKNGYKQGQKELVNNVLKFSALVMVVVIISVIVF